MRQWIARVLHRGRRWLYLVPRVPAQVQVEITNRCNFDCVMCQRKDLGVVFRDMPFDLFRRVLDRIPDSTRLVCLTGWGEPLLHPDLPEMIRYARDRGKLPIFTTNGVLLRGDAAERILASGVHALTFSIDSLEPEAGTLLHWEPSAVVRNVREVVGRIRRDSLPIRTGINTTLHAGREEDVFRVIRFAAETGIEQVSVLRLDLRFQPRLRRCAWEEERSILRRAHRLGRRLSVRVQSVLSDHGPGGGLLSRLNPRCPKPFDYVYVNWKGEVTPCCNLPTLGLQNILEHDLQQVWNGKAFSRFRREQRAICGKCDVLYYRYHPDLPGDAARVS
ncbi:MAG: radical SAM protein [Acidobacteria bacterium]|nr:radical SAM protein [Acidobacteriota bacterium]